MTVTGVVFQSDKIYIDYTDDTYSIKANCDIPCGELVLLEHVLHGSIKYVICGILNDEELFNTLYPRKIKYNSCDQYSQENCLSAIDKMGFNAFDFNDETTLGNIFSKFNHNCSPNCHMDMADNMDGKKTYGMWTHTKINKGEELTIDYTNGHTDLHEKFGIKFNIKCNCTSDDKIKNEKKSKILYKLGAVYRDRDKSAIIKYVDYYLASKDGKKILKELDFINKKSKRIIFADEC